MVLAGLDNEVVFKKAFTDLIVFKGFVRDIIGIDIEPDSIETEKSFDPRPGSIAFKYDIFAEDSKQRVIVEIQKVDYDHNFDRFLHYHLQGISEQQRNAADYTIQRTVYTIVVITAPYKVNKQTGEIVRDEVLITNLNPRNLHDKERNLFGHKLIFLNPNYKGSETPENYRDWLDLIYESMHHPKNPKLNPNNPAVQRAASLVQYDNISPEELGELKIATGRAKVLQISYEEGLEEGKEKGLEEGLIKGKEEGIVLAIKALITQGILSDEQIAQALNVGVEKVKEIKEKLI